MTLRAKPLVTAGIISSRIQNLSERSADVTIVFTLDDVVVHRTFLRVPGKHGHHGHRTGTG